MVEAISKRGAVTAERIPSQGSTINGFELGRLRFDWRRVIKGTAAFGFVVGSVMVGQLVGADIAFRVGMPIWLGGLGGAFIGAFGSSLLARKYLP